VATVAAPARVAAAAPCALVALLLGRAAGSLVGLLGFPNVEGADASRARVPVSTVARCKAEPAREGEPLVRAKGLRDCGRRVGCSPVVGLEVLPDEVGSWRRLRSWLMRR